ncbi:MAG: hypothetical protein LBD02_08685 [Christensenellaceae bacterium]|nr:hypothetical protein [Christensenellaceae bacterium]
MKRLVNLWLMQLRSYLPWQIGLVFVALVFVSCGMSHAFSIEKIRVVFVPLTPFIALRGVLREVWCFALLLPCALHFLGAPLAGAVLIIRAYAIGFAWGWWLSTLGVGRLLSFLLLVFPQGLLVLLCLIGACCTGFAQAFKRRSLAPRSYLIHLSCWCLPALCTLVLEWLAVALML